MVVKKKITLTVVVKEDEVKEIVEAARQMLPTWKIKVSDTK
jgi:nitrogen regulatory protein PII